MNKVYEFIINKYGYDEPVFTRELKKQINISDVALRQNMKRLSDKGLLIMVKNGVYYVPKANSVLKKPRVNFEKVISRKYIKPKDSNVIGYTSGINFANQLGLTTQTASVTTVVTNEVGRNEHEVSFGKKVVKLRRPKAPINDKNYKILQVLDLLNEFDRLIEIPLAAFKNIIKGYLMDVNISPQEFYAYIKNYPKKTLINLIETGLFDEIARS